MLYKVWQGQQVVAVMFSEEAAVRFFPDAMIEYVGHGMTKAQTKAWLGRWGTWVS